MTEERFEEIRAEYENAKDVEYVRWQFAKDGTPSTVTDSQANDDMFDLIAEVSRLRGILEEIYVEVEDGSLGAIARILRHEGVTSGGD